jgi:hypothetical protein
MKSVRPTAFISFFRFVAFPGNLLADSHGTRKPELECLRVLDGCFPIL